MVLDKNFPSHVTTTKNIGAVALNLRFHFVDKILAERKDGFFTDFSSGLDKKYCIIRWRQNFLKNSRFVRFGGTKMSENSLESKNAKNSYDVNITKCLRKFSAWKFSDIFVQKLCDILIFNGKLTSWEFLTSLWYLWTRVNFMTFLYFTIKSRIFQKFSDIFDCNHAILGSFSGESLFSGAHYLMFNLCKFCIKTHQVYLCGFCDL